MYVCVCVSVLANHSHGIQHHDGALSHKKEPMEPRAYMMQISYSTGTYTFSKNCIEVIQLFLFNLFSIFTSLLCSLTCWPVKVFRVEYVRTISCSWANIDENFPISRKVFLFVCVFISIHCTCHPKTDTEMCDSL